MVTASPEYDKPTSQTMCVAPSTASGKAAREPVRLLTLPPEIRSLIYRYAYTPHTIVWLTATRHRSLPVMESFSHIFFHPRKYPLHQACRQLRDELRQLNLPTILVRTTKEVIPRRIWRLSACVISRLERLEVNFQYLEMKGRPGGPGEPKRRPETIKSADDVVEEVQKEWRSKAGEVLKRLPRLRLLQVSVRCSDSGVGWEDRRMFVVQGMGRFLNMVSAGRKGCKVKMEDAKMEWRSILVFEASKPRSVWAEW